MGRASRVPAQGRGRLRRSVLKFRSRLQMGLSRNLASPSWLGRSPSCTLVCRIRMPRSVTKLFRNLFFSDGGVLMRTWLTPAWALACRFAKFGAAAAIASLLSAAAALAQTTGEAGGEASLKLPDLSQVQFLGVDGHKLLLFGILFCIFRLIFGLVIYSRPKNLPVHRSMRDISELIYETCKTYLITQGKFLVVLWLFIAVVIVLYFGVLAPVQPVKVTLPIILIFSLIGIAGSYGVAWFGIRVNTFANSRTAFASLPGKPY